VMTQFHTRRIKGNRSGLFGNFLDLAGGDKQELSIAVNEACDQLGTGHAINVHVRTGDPFHWHSPYGDCFSL
jgi:hypothetical protein